MNIIDYIRKDVIMNNFYGTDIIIIQKHENGDRVKTHKKKRIDKKWKKKYGYYNGLKLNKGQIISFENKLYMSKNTYNQIKRSVNYDR